MTSQARFAEIAALVGDPGRATMLNALLDGRALTATELAKAGGVTPQTASGHLARLTEAGLLTVVKQGRHRYHRLATLDVARMLESIMCVAAATSPQPVKIVTGPRSAALRTARDCYDHMAGRLAVLLADSLITQGVLEITEDAGIVTADGRLFLESLGIVTRPSRSTSKKQQRLFCRPCLDWSERRPHLAGKVGTLLRNHCLHQGWVRRTDEHRALQITRRGEQAFHRHFGIHADDIERA
ncbi:MAG: helix-turn-helix transcriptional regulator [Pseudomonadota bacterium]